MSRRHHRAVGLVAAVVAAGQFMTPGNAWAAGSAATAVGTAAPAVGVSAVGTVASVRTADSTLVVTRAYRFRDSRPKTVKFSLTASTTIVGAGPAGGLGAIRTGMQVAVTGTLTGTTVVATRVVIRR